MLLVIRGRRAPHTFERLRRSSVRGSRGSPAGWVRFVSAVFEVVSDMSVA
jgi:hypothetical protein